MKLRLLNSVLLLSGFGLLGVAAWEYRAASDGPGATIGDPERQVQMDVGQTSLVTFHVHNPTRHQVQVVGLAIC